MKSKSFNISDLIPEGNEIIILNKASKEMLNNLKNSIKKAKTKAKVFLGGSFAKGTLMKKKKYDIDIYVRFDEKIKEISNELEKILKAGKIKYKKIHGSRDYFQTKHSEILVFEIIPVREIKKPAEAENVTDLSCFHVSYVKRKLEKKNNLAKEILLLKAFCMACNVYGAESWIRGFSGYALECLVIYYGSFEKTIKALIKAKGKQVIDPEKHYRNSHEALLSLNESKQSSPIIFIDPTWKERNILSALSEESFKRFLLTAKKYISKPSKEFFIEKKINLEELKEKAEKRNSQLITIKLITDKQEGDIAGTKLRKAASFIISQLAKNSEVILNEFIYEGGKEARLYIALKQKQHELRIGPLLSMNKHSVAFRKMHKEIIIKKGRMYAKLSFSKNLKQTAKETLNIYKEQIKSMSVDARID